MIRKLLRYIIRRFGKGAWQYKHPEEGRWMFKNQWGKVYGIRDFGRHLVLFDISRETPEVICKLTKGKKIKEIHD